MAMHRSQKVVLPAGISGYSDEEMDFFRRLVQNNAHLIMEFSQEGGILDASNL